MKTLLLTVLLLAANGSRAATPPDTVAAAPPRATRSERPWYRPRHLIVQTGGGIGMVAVGAGYTYLNNKVETDLLLGYVPKRYAGSTLTLASGKLLYSPFTVRLAEQWQLKPLTVGGYLSYTHGTLNDELKGQYSSDYYWFSTDTRYGPLVGGRVTYLAAPVAATGQPRKLSFYYELGSNDLYLASYLTNRNGGLSFGQLLTLALGVKADF